MAEYAIALLIIAPIVAGLALLYTLGTGEDGKPKASGALQERFEASSVPAREMSPSKAELCDPADPEVTEEFCF